MVRLSRKLSWVVSTFALVIAPACSGGSGGSSDDSTGSASTTGDTTATATSGDTEPNPTTVDPTTGSPTSDDTTVDPSTPTTTDGPMTSSTTGSTTDTSTGDTDPGTSTGTGEDTGTSTTGAVDPSDIPEIPDDGMPSSAHYKKIPLGMSEAKQGYWEYLPPGYGGGEDYPLLVFLHGIGENGNGDSELDKVNNTGLPRLIQQDQWPTDRPFVVVSPQHIGGGCPGAAEVHDFIEFAANKYDINPARVYLTGLSCGAIGAWGYLGEYLDQQIAAMVPVAGDGKGAFNKAKCMLGLVPIWAFHGDNDDTVNVSGTTEPITGLQMCDPKPEAEMVIYPGVGHDSWSMTYDLSAGHDIYAWLLAHYKK